MNNEPIRGHMENREFMAYPICVGDLVCKSDEEMAVYYRVIRMPGETESGYAWIINADPQLTAKEAKPEKVRTDGLEHARSSDCQDPSCQCP